VQRIVPITTGQLLVRNTATRECALIGVVRLPHDVVIRENAAYLAMFLADSADLVDRPLDKGLPDELEGQGINAALRASVWAPYQRPWRADGSLHPGAYRAESLGGLRGE
jgi:hypothetical protein